MEKIIDYCKVPMYRLSVIDSILSQHFSSRKSRDSGIHETPTFHLIPMMRNIFDKIAVFLPTRRISQCPRLLRTGKINLAGVKGKIRTWQFFAKFELGNLARTWHKLGMVKCNKSGKSYSIFAFY